MQTINTDSIIKAIEIMADVVIESETYFCELDSNAGDGDFGTSLAKGFRMIKQEWESIDKDNIGSFMQGCGMVITEHCGGASGPLWGGSFRTFGKMSSGKKELTLAEFADIRQGIVDFIMKKGGAKLGDKTMLDSLIPFVKCLKKNENLQIKEAMQKAIIEAQNGAESTKIIVATKGRASYLGERSIGFPDAGAVAIYFIANEVYKKM